ncbi:MAG: nucleotidyltransferase family protein [Paludibacteraceae bacterium]|nr:nucleotidyltransferase family protein [Paludibacteraceae bacterium]
MNAFIFAAGLGTRLKPLTDTMPKALVPVGGKPLLYHVIEKLKSAGIKKIVINIHHFGEMIIDYVKENNNFGIEIVFSDERQMLLETGGAIKHAVDLLGDEPFLIHNVDILSNVDIKALINAHTESNSAATLLVSKRNSTRALLFSSDGNLTAWTNKTTGEVKTPYSDIEISNLNEFAFSGIHIFSPRLFKYFGAYPEKFSIIDFYLNTCKDENIKAYTQEGLQLLDVGKLDSLEKAEEFVKS